MTGSKNRTQSKCRMWEKERRNKLSTAFVDLAQCLPSTPATTTKILILQRAVKYIKELQKISDECQANEKKHPGNITVLLDKLSLLEERCSQLIEHMQQNGLSVSSPLLLNPKESNITIDIECTSEIVEGNKNIELENKLSDVDKSTADSVKEKVEENVQLPLSDASNKEDKSNANAKDEKLNLSKITKRTPRKLHLTKKKNSKRKLNGENVTNVSYPSKLTQKNNTINNVWLTNGNQNGAMMLGNTILPLLPKASPLLLSSTQQTPAIFLLQRPVITNFSNKKDSNPNNLPVIMPVNSPDKQFHRIYSNVYGLDVTKTTMVNKVPIPAFSSSSSMVKGKSKNSCSLRVSHKNRRKFLNSIKTAKKNESKTLPLSSENDKENISKEVKPDNVVRESVIVNTDNDVGKDVDVTLVSSDKNESNEVATKDSNKSEILSNELKNLETPQTDKNVIETKVENTQNNVIVRDKTQNFLNEKVELDIIEKKSDVLPQEQVKVCLPENKPVQSKSDFEINNCKANNNSTSVSLDCRMHMNKGNNIMGSSDIPDDLLASFVAPQEPMPSSPLASSPLATSPTAAFLLAFPLVCSGPRPDTPLNDNLQTPNLCSLENFSFFTSKDAAIGNSHHLFTDCQSKQLAPILSGKPKQSWSNPQSFPKNEMTLKNENCSRIPTVNKDSSAKLPISTSSTCAYSNTQAIFQNSKLPNADSQYYLGESLFNYETLTSLSNQKESITNTKDDNLPSKQYNFGNAAQNNVTKNKSVDNIVCPSTTSSYTQNILTSTACTNNRSYNYNAASSSNADSCKRNQNNDNCMKLVLPGVIPEYSSTSKNIDIPFTFQNQSKAVFPNSSNIYTSCNTYNPFSSDFTSNSMNLGLTCGNSLNSIRTKATTTYFPEFNSSNIYSQNCNIWSEETQIDYDPGKIDYNRKLNIPIPFNQNQSHNIVPDFQSDIRFSLPVISKCSNIKQNPIVDSKNSKIAKCSTKDSKYVVESKIKSDYMNQKGPVNWMTSDVTHNDAFFPNYKEIKSEQNLMLSNTNQSCLDVGTNIPGISSLNCKKTELFEQPFFPIPPSSYMSQVVTEENQFTWSPSKLTTFGDNSALAPCSLPTLVGDLALGIISEPKLVYQPFSQEQESTSKDRKAIVQKSINNKNNCSQTAEANVSQNFFSVSQLVERGKMPDSVNDHSKSCITHKNVIATEEVKNFNSNKVYDPSVNVSVFPPEHYLIQPLSNNQHLPKDTNFNKVDNSNKNANKNNYSTEALLQNNTQYQNSRKQKQSIQKLYGDGSYPIHGNQFISSNHPLQFDNFAQNQQYSNTTFPYSGTTVSMNSSFYSSPNFITSTNTMGTSNYINTSFHSDMNDFQSSDNLFFPPKTENVKSKQQIDTLPDFTKYSINKPTMMNKDSSKIKPESCVKKDMAPPNKRQKKQKTTYSNNYGDRCFGTIPNQTNSPKPIDESFYGYTSSQMHPYPAQPNLLPTMHSQKSNFSAKPSVNVMSSSPNPVGTSLTNFNLSTIFPEINKRSTMPGFNDTQHLSAHLSKAPSSGVFH